MSSAICFNLDQSKIMSSGKELNAKYTRLYENQRTKSPDKHILWNNIKLRYVVMYIHVCVINGVDKSKERQSCFAKKDEQ